MITQFGIHQRLPFWVSLWLAIGALSVPIVMTVLHLIVAGEITSIYIRLASHMVVFLYGCLAGIPVVPWSRPLVATPAS